MASTPIQPTPKLDGSRIRSARHAKGWPQRVLAARADMAQSDLSEYENGHRVPEGARLVKLARALDVTVESLFEQ